MATHPVLLAFISAALFGAATPASKSLLADLSPFQLAGLLYLGAALGVAPIAGLRQVWRMPWRLNPANRWRLWGAVLAGGVAGPVLLLAGLKVASAASVSLWLNLELVATAVLGHWFFRDHLTRYRLARRRRDASCRHTAVSRRRGSRPHGGRAGVAGLLLLGSRQSPDRTHRRPIAKSKHVLEGLGSGLRQSGHRPDAASLRRRRPGFCSERCSWASGPTAPALRSIFTRRNGSGRRGGRSFFPPRPFSACCCRRCCSVNPYSGCIIWRRCCSWSGSPCCSSKATPTRTPTPP